MAIGMPTHPKIERMIWGKKKRTIAQSLCGSLAAVDWHIFIDSQTIATLS
jgi:hypothetical protein